MKTTERLVLHYEDFEQRTVALFQEMKQSSVLREQFLNHPEAIIAERVLDGSSPAISVPIDQRYRQFFTLLHHASFRAQIEQCEKEMPLQERSAPARCQAIAQAAVQSGAIQPRECEATLATPVVSKAGGSGIGVLSVVVGLLGKSPIQTPLSRQDLLSSLASLEREPVAEAQYGL